MEYKTVNLQVIERNSYRVEIEVPSHLSDDEIIALVHEDTTLSDYVYDGSKHDGFWQSECDVVGVAS